MIFQVTKGTTVPLSVNNINFDHLRYEAQDTHNVAFLWSVSQFSQWVYSFNKIKCPKIKLHTDALESSWGPPIGESPEMCVL